jgi:hypothetical protein
LALLLVSALAGCGPRQRGPRVDAEAARPDLGFGFGDVPRADVAARLCTKTESLPFKPLVTDMLILFDRSGSMSAGFGDGTRYGVEAELLGQLLPVYDDKIRFGFAQFPARGACAAGQVGGCCAEDPSVPIGLASGPAIVDAIEGAAPVEGNTPTAEAIRRARVYYEGLADGVSDRFVLLSTDGRPSCTADGRLPATLTGSAADSPACADAVAEVDRLVATGVKLIVLGIGPGLAMDPDGAPSCLDALARRGGTDRGEGLTPFFSGADPEALEVALQRIFGGLVRPPCVIDLGVTPSDRTQVRVLFDGREIPRNRINGWDFDSAQDTRRIRIFGDACHRLDRFQVKDVEVQFGCPPCTEERLCE